MNGPSMEYISVFFFALAGAAVIGVLLRVFKKHLRFGREEADERQQLIRGRGYRLSTFLYMAELALLLLLQGVGAELPFTQSGLLAIFLLIPIGAYAVYCVFHDAYLGIRENGKGFCILGAAIVGIELISTLLNLRDGTLLEDGKLGFSVINPAIGVLWLVILISLSVRKAQLRREDEE